MYNYWIHKQNIGKTQVFMFIKRKINKNSTVFFAFILKPGYVSVVTARHKKK